ncbi:hypothetical protein [Verrucomicrobium sp. 3C]|uniref:hypothetical protein n=1 Tax=Verrucomicrobium sp. 3C TaxID=1134055 RepID=UPI00036A1C1B|nr:hypothetical protein [Verrucomicrobium sp. 3C]
MRWITFAGGYYTPSKFVAEAKKLGISRKVPTSLAKSMNVGDEVCVLDWTGKEAQHFCTFKIDSLLLDSALAKVVADKLGLTITSSGRRTVVRECGSFEVSCHFVTTAPIRTQIEAAESAGPIKSVMIGGSITEEIHPPRTVPGVGKFFRGFARETPAHGIPASKSAKTRTVPGILASTPSSSISGMVYGLEGYKQRTTIARHDLQLDLPIELPAGHPFLTPSRGGR